MAGRGPQPKDPARRVRSDSRKFREIEIPASSGMRPLPDDLLEEGDSWHPATVRWWRRWCESPLAEDLPEVDWGELESCAVLHNQFMARRTYTLAQELRLRMAKFGATPEDRQRLRIITTQADDAHDKRQGRVPQDGKNTARSRYGDLRVLPTHPGGSDALEA